MKTVIVDKQTKSLFTRTLNYKKNIKYLEDLDDIISFMDSRKISSEV